MGQHVLVIQWSYVWDFSNHDQQSEMGRSGPPAAHLSNMAERYVRLFQEQWQRGRIFSRIVSGSFTIDGKKPLFALCNQYGHFQLFCQPTTITAQTQGVFATGNCSEFTSAIETM
jgi:hypothetical protein